MKLSTGTDIVSVQRIEKAYRKFGERFVKRILTDNEIKEFDRRKDKIIFLASRFAAKEAVYKAYSITPFSWHRIEIIKEGEKPAVKIDGTKVNGLSLSLSHEKDYAIAFCVFLEK